MRSLFFKITLAFVLVSLAGAGLAALLIQQRTSSAFDTFLFDQNKATFTSTLTQYYESNGSWDNVGEALRQGSKEENPESLYPPSENDHRGPTNTAPFPFMLVDANGIVVYGRGDQIGQTVSSTEINNGVALEVDGQTVGWLLNPPPRPEWERNTPQGAFLRTVNQSILFGAIGALVLALVLGSILARSLTAPLRDLAAATSKVAKGELGYTVQVRSRDEIGQLGDSFNQMSTDLAKSNRLRKQMTADIAHDLRTPLSIMLGYTEALSDGKLDGSEEIFSTMHQVTRHLSHLVDDLRTISLADAGELPINPVSLPPAALIERTVATYQPHAHEKGVSLRIDAQPGLPEIKVDPERMEQVLGNLVSNALRYTPQGGWVELAADAQADTLRLRVSDNGSGISPEDLPKVFTRFYRGDSARQNNGEAGLGLTIAKSLVEAQGGKIEVKSEVGQGTVFSMYFPCG
ncbi:MAG: HAMP domain-containing sensor histidine kinase [Chloroflexota bacterium]